MRFKKFVASVALLGLSTQAAAQQACLTNAEAETMVQAILPSLITNVSEQCGSFLPANADLIARSQLLSERYTSAADAARPQAAGIALRILDDGESAGALDSDSGGELVLGIFEMGIAVAMAEAMDASSCPIANRVFTVLEPLPPRNFSSLLVLLIELGGPDDDEGSPRPFSICSAA
ncbi:hypothetical protein [Parasphingopyxis lamellibrachiae]|uniref:Uncharacterized protein n=1 Tax=Parasphingopyxis lamellibrachiae TaxID=680125 RepID=A0A3D9FET0_9SPHN|nr:hypothetical protein [Parasphingopyxis lamellibrachiae]RED15571.1 hypothetical protein DFR46_0568 [Parasphingopyxis lamellibrachiae]